MKSHKVVVTKAASQRSVRETRITAVRRALDKYFLGSAATTELFWNASNPSLGERSPSQLVKTGKLNKVEQYVSYLSKHTRSVKADVQDEPVPSSFVTLEGTPEEIRERLKEPGTAYRCIVVAFPNAKSYYTHAPVYRQIISRLPEILRRQQCKEQLLCARFLYSLTADLPVKVPKLKLRRIANRSG